MKNSYSRARWLVFCSVLLVMSCNETKFQSVQEPARPLNHRINFDGIDDFDAGQRQLSRFDSVDFTIQAAGERVVHSMDAASFPVDLYFLVDTSNSMTPSIRAVRDAIVALATDLKNRRMDLNAGFIGFIDTEQQSRDLDHIRYLTSDIEGLKEYISKVQVAQSDSRLPNFAVNRDFPEASLWAVRYGLERFISGDGRPNAAKVLLLITDVVGHDGLTGIATTSSHARNCHVDDLRARLNDYAKTLASPDLLRFYYVVPDPTATTLSARERQNAEATCLVQGIGQANAKQQMEYLVAGLQPDVDESKRSGPLLTPAGRLAWPLQDHNLASLIAAAVDNTRPSTQRLTCEAKSVVVRSDGETIFTWKPETTPGDTNQNTIQLEQVISGARSSGSNALEFVIDRCCREVNEATSQTAEPNHCVQRFNQKITYTIVNQ